MSVIALLMVLGWLHRWTDAQMDFRKDGTGISSLENTVIKSHGKIEGEDGQTIIE